MVNTIDMQQMRYLNLFEKITGVRTRHCFSYNEFIVFAVPEIFISKAVGKEGRNAKKLNGILGKRIKVIANPESINGDSDEIKEFSTDEIKKFIGDIVSPVEFKDLEVNDETNEVIITAGSQSKAALIGRMRRRESELKEIVRDYFKKDLRIV